MKKVDRKLAFRAWWIFVILVLSYTIPRQANAKAHYREVRVPAYTATESEKTRYYRYRDEVSAADAAMTVGVASIFASWLALGAMVEPKPKKVKKEEEMSAPA